MYTIPISRHILVKCTEFANNSVASSIDKYAERKQKNIKKIIKDIRNGKVAEEIVYQSLKDQLKDLSAPDYQIYQASGKSWSADLIDNIIDIKIAVKSQSVEAEKKYGASWIFQGGDVGDYDREVFGKQNNNLYLALISLDIPQRTAYFKALIKANWACQNNLFKEVKRKELQGNKLAIYYQDLLDKNNLWQDYLN